MPEDLSETFRVMREHSQKKRKRNREYVPERLRQEGIEFVEKNGGAHLILGDIDFWPGTGLWISRKGPRGRGIAKLIKHIQTRRNR